jgi:hypothetical protein
MSILQVRRKHPALFPSSAWLEDTTVAKDADAFAWRQLNLTPLGLGQPFAQQQSLSKTAEVFS